MRAFRELRILPQCPEVPFQHMDTAIQQPIGLPEHVYENKLWDLTQLLDSATGDPVHLDFGRVRFYIPGAIVLLVARIKKWKAEGKRVRLYDAYSCPAFAYLQRINFFFSLGLELPEDFERHASQNRFVTIEQIGGAKGKPVGSLATDVARCIAPESDTDDPETSGVFDLLEYGVSELALNVVQHSDSVGFCCAQFTPKSQLVRVGISDFGRGIRESFQFFNSPHWREGMNDREAILAALEPRVSCKTHLQSMGGWGGAAAVNTGVGLSILRAVAEKLGGTFFIASGKAGFYFTRNLAKEFSGPGSGFPGTICAFSFNRKDVRNYANLLYETKASIGLLQTGDNFDTLFT